MRDYLQNIITQPIFLGRNSALSKKFFELKQEIVKILGIKSAHLSSKFTSTRMHSLVKFFLGLLSATLSYLGPKIKGYRLIRYVHNHLDISKNTLP